MGPALLLPPPPTTTRPQPLMKMPLAGEETGLRLGICGLLWPHIPGLLAAVQVPTQTPLVQSSRGSWVGIADHSSLPEHSRLGTGGKASLWCERLSLISWTNQCQ